MATTESTADAASEVSVPWRSPTLFAVLATTLLTPMDVPLVSPALTEVQSAFGVSAGSAGLLITVYALPGILVAPLIGSLADRIGRRCVLSGCLALFGLAGTAIAFTNDFTVALGLRALQGLAAGSVLSALAMTVVGDRYSGAEHDAVMGVTSAMLSLGTAVYPVVGGYLAARAWNAPFLVYATALPVAGLVFVALDEETSARRAPGGYLRGAIDAVPTGRATALYGVMFLSFAFLFGGIYTVLPFYLADRFALPTPTIGLVTSAVLLVTAAVSMGNGRLSARASTTSLLAAGFALFALGFLGVAVADGLPVLVGALLVFGVGSGLITPTLFAAISTLAPDHVRAGVMSLQTTTIGTSQAVAPAVFTAASAGVGYEATLLGASGAAAVCIVVVALAPLDP